MYGDGRRFRTLLVALLIGLMPVGLGACTDEDDDGAVTDEEIGELGDTADSVAEEIGEEVQEGAEELGE